MNSKVLHIAVLAPQRWGKIPEIFGLLQVGPTVDTACTILHGMIIQSLIIDDKSVKLKCAVPEVYFPSLYLEISVGAFLGHRGKPLTTLLVIAIMECEKKKNDNIKLALNNFYAFSHIIRK